MTIKTTDNVTLGIEQIWHETICSLGDVLTYSAIESWIKPLAPVSFDKKVFKVATTSNLSKEWIIKNYSNQIKKALKDITGESCRFDIVIDRDIKSTLSLKLEHETANNNEQSKVEQKSEPKVEKPLNDFQIDALKSTSYNLNLRYNFENFVLGENSKFAHAASIAVAKAPGQTHNPLFIYGGAGLGKTHLMQAIGHFILVNHPGKKLKYTTTEAFTNDLINCLIRGGAQHKMNEFRQRYRQVDVLLIDDIQFIEGKGSTQDEIFHTFDYLHSHGKQIIITSDRPPKEIPTLTDRLRSRFEWGLLADIQPPSLETRVAILKKKAMLDQVIVSDKILELIASAFHTNVRELEGAFNRVVAYSSITGEPISVDSVKRVINISERERKLTIDNIIEITAEIFGIETSEIKGQSRAKDISLARQISIYLCRKMTNLSFPQIGHAIGGRKHTTILYAYEKIKEEITYNKMTEHTVNEVIKNINNRFIV